MSWIATVWRSVSKNTRGAPPVTAELWNTGLVSGGVMKVSAASTAAEVSGGARRGQGRAWLMAFLLGWRAGRPRTVAQVGARRRANEFASGRLEGHSSGSVAGAAASPAASARPGAWRRSAAHPSTGTDSTRHPSGRRRRTGRSACPARGGRRPWAAGRRQGHGRSRRPAAPARCLRARSRRRAPGVPGRGRAPTPPTRPESGR